MEVLIEFKPQIIHLTGDKEFEAVSNYMWYKHHRNLILEEDKYHARCFAINFMNKYNAEAKLHKYKDKIFYYPVFK